MRIAFDHQAFSLQVYGGVSRYFFHLAQQFGRNEHQVRVIAPLHRNHYIAELPQGTVWGWRVGYYPPKTVRFFLELNSLIAQPAIRAWQPQIMHETYYARSGAAPTRCPTVITVHDMIHELFAEEFSTHDPTSNNKRLAIERANHVICVSESTRRDLVRLFDVPPDKVSVVHSGVERISLTTSGQEDGGNGREKPYLLYVGNRSGYKNFARFLKAVASCCRLKTDFDVVAFGGGAFSAGECALITQLGFREEQVSQVGGSDALLSRLFRRARALVFPSLYEGFGLPLLEAMAHRCPVVSSNTSSMPEVVGDAGEYFDPTSIDDMAQAIERTVYSDARIQLLNERGTVRLDQFSWQRCADETLSIYRTLLD